MADPFYPSIDLDFIIDRMKRSGKLEEHGIVKTGSTTTFVYKGSQATYKRRVRVRELNPGQVCFEQAAHIAFNFSFMGALLNRLEINRDWKEGGYILPNNNTDL